MDSVLSKNIMIEQNPSSKENPITVSLRVHMGIQVGGLFANGPKQLCFES